VRWSVTVVDTLGGFVEVSYESAAAVAEIRYYSIDLTEPRAVKLEPAQLRAIVRVVAGWPMMEE
jgi:hypothetical protein